MDLNAGVCSSCSECWCVLPRNSLKETFCLMVPKTKEDQIFLCPGGFGSSFPAAGTSGKRQISLLTGSGLIFRCSPLKPSKFREFGKLMPLLAALMWQHHSQFRWSQLEDGDRTSSILVKISSRQPENCTKERFEFALMEILKKSK